MLLRYICTCMAKQQEAIRERVHTNIREPRKYKVLIHNDDFTTMDFVVDVLMRYFNKNFAEAEDIMYQVHEQGSGVCGIYPHEIAESKVNQVIEHARANNYPLLCVLRPH